MGETIRVNQVDNRVEDEHLNFDKFEKPTFEGQIIYDHLKVVTTTDSYLNVEVSNDGQFRFIFYRNEEIMAIGITYQMKAGNNYQVTARKGHQIGIQQIKE